MKRWFRRWLRDPRWLRWGLNIYPPYLGAGIKVRTISPDYRYVEVEMRLHWYNRNYVGTHFGGSLYSMTDPFYMLMLINILGPDYVVWDQAAEIVFRRPGRGKVRAVFTLNEAQIEDIRRATADGKPYRPTFMVNVVDEAGEVVAEVKKVLYVRRKRQG
ncbi:hypothetical protein ARMA_3142 [Ardenticatena maritima]|uniref:Tetrameric acyl-CoA thioesterase n=1 Tax=Ardenticatena maritima TaxID=872965 RepID=A0A0M8KC52_9CHLR|nr:DUF4442 domain-containing protein [Ardenticatena maritima]KPL89231.1 tetrameric acyl-CoA thioesterase [Ardenticatena maritima]GAP64719.1 hypothetical protein ARMA_3142 [Ardenticatena maritima]